MPPNALTWKALSPVTVATPLTEGNFLTALKALFDQSKYADGSTRTGTTTAWTTEALTDGSFKCMAPGGSHPLGLILHFAVGTGNTSLPKSFSELISAGSVYGTLVLNPGTYSANTATPWGTTANTAPVRCFGYCQMSPYDSTFNAITALTSVSIRMWESADAVVIHTWSNGTTGTLSVLGGWMVPDVSATGAGDAESDGVIYGIATSGMAGGPTTNSAFHANTGDINAAFPTAVTAANVAFLNNNTTGTASTKARASVPHCGVFVPGTAEVAFINRFGGFNSSSIQLASISRKLVKMPIQFTSLNNYVGRAREIWAFPKALNGLTLRTGGSGGADKAYVVSFSNSGTTDSILLSI